MQWIQASMYSGMCSLGLFIVSTTYMYIALLYEMPISLYLFVYLNFIFKVIIFFLIYYFQINIIIQEAYEAYSMFLWAFLYIFSI